MADSTARIGKITIVTGELFDETGLGEGFYRSANALHEQTPPSLIRRFLLFKEGDPYDAEKIAETERNLRKLDFINDVSVTTCSEPDGSIDVTVRTSDAWTTDPAIDMSHQSAAKSFSATLTQKDVLGSGADVSVTMGTDVKRSTKKIEIDDPSFVLPYLNVEATLASNSDGFARRLLVQRPFFSYDTRFSFDALYDRTLENDRTYQDGRLFSLFQRSHGEEMLRLSYALDSDSAVQHRLTFDVDNVFDRFSPISSGIGSALPSRQFRFFDVGYSLFDDRYAKLAWIDQDKVDDFHLGSQLDVRLGVDPTTSQRIWRASIDASRGFELGAHAYLFPCVSWSTRHDPGGLANELASSDVRFIWKNDGTHPSALVSRLRLDLGRNLDPETQLFADGITGLRAYPAFAFEGDRRVIFNLEQRWRAPWLTGWS